MISQNPSIQSFLSTKNHFVASLWTIEREDGTIQRFTNHDSRITYEGVTYTPVGSGKQSAAREPVGLKERNLEMVGAITSSKITSSDLKAGLYRNAKVTEVLVNYRYPWQGAYLTNIYWMTEVKWNGEIWEVQLNDITTRLRQEVGETYSRNCRHVLGDDNCGVDVPAITETGSVTAVNTQKIQFQTDLTGEANDYFKWGFLTWTSGDNAGLGFEVLSYAGTGGMMTLFFPTPYNIETGDAFTVYPGCGRIVDHCKGTDGDSDRPWTNNYVNYGGFPFIPGEDAANETPNLK